jgi:hypothetical protein
VLIPLRNRHFDFLASLEQTNKVIADGVQGLHTRLNEIQCMRRD